MKHNLHWLIFVGMLSGIMVGLWINHSVVSSRIFEVLDLFGKTLFIGALKMLVAPLIFFSILTAITSLSNRQQLWSMGWKTLLFYLTTTSIAVAIGLFFVLTIRPGHWSNRNEIRDNWIEHRQQLHNNFSGTEAQVNEASHKTPLDIIRHTLEQTISNPFLALSETRSLGIIFFALILGAALIAVGKVAEPVLPVIQGINAAIMKLTTWIMLGSPFFIFCLVASLVGQLGAGVFQLLSGYIITIITGIAVHLVVLLAICYFMGRIPPWRFILAIQQAWMVAFATRSSAATLPVTISTVQDELGISAQTAEFVLPLGATINMDGTALYEGVAVIFLIQLFGGMPGVMIELTPVTTIIIFMTAVLASIGAAAVPNAGLVTMVLVANAVGLSVEYIPMIFAVDAFLDMFRTSTNVMGDMVGAVVIDKFEK